jgi:undecaprenyl diphosphate synthase
MFRQTSTPVMRVAFALLGHLVVVGAGFDVSDEDCESANNERYVGYCASDLCFVENCSALTKSIAARTLLHLKGHTRTATDKHVFSSLLTLVFGLCVGFCLGRLRTIRPHFGTLSSRLCSIYSIAKIWMRYHFNSSQFAVSTYGIQKVTVFGANGEKIKKNYIDTPRESGCDLSAIPQHVAVIMDGNRRYGKRRYGKGSMGHYDGARMALQVIEWMSTEGVKHLTLYAFSTENWNRESTEVDTLMGLFLQFVEGDLRPVVFNRKVRVRLICTDKDHLPPKLYQAVQDLCEETSVHPENSLTLNVCLSYGSRGEITCACQNIASACLDGRLKPEDVTESTISQHLLTRHSVDPDVLIRTSGEERISNFLLWQLAYTELFFLDKDWPELEKEDFLTVIRRFAAGRKRRFGH